MPLSRVATAAAAWGLSLLGQATAVGEKAQPSPGPQPSSWVATALDVGRCLGVDAGNVLQLEPCLDGKGKAWRLTPDDAEKAGTLGMLAVPNGCVNAVNLKLESCDGSAGQEGWTWSLRTLQLKQGGKCLHAQLCGTGGSLAMKACDKSVGLKDGQAWSVDDQNGEGSPSNETFVLLPTSRPQIEILDKLKFPLLTSGRYLIDASGTPVKLVGVNWIGAHLFPMVQYGLNYVGLKTLVKYIKHMGFNHVRMNYALSLLHKPGESMAKGTERKLEPPQSLLEANPDLKGKSELELFDRAIQALTSEGLLVILNNHMSESGWCCGTDDGNGIWYNENYTETDWLSALTFLSARYKDNPRVFGHDLRNEPRPDLRGWTGMPLFAQRTAKTTNSKAPKVGLVPAWGLESDWSRLLGLRFVDWRRGASKGAVAAWKGNPDITVIVEGNWFASDLANVRKLPLNLAQDCLRSRLMYSLHEYPWFSMVYAMWGYLANPFDFEQQLGDLANIFGTEDEERTKLQKTHPGSEMPYKRYKEQRLDSGFHLVRDNYAPVWVSEFGTGRRWADKWYNNTMKLFGELDVSWAWWPLDVDKIPVGFDPKDPDGEMDAAGLFNPGLRNYRSVVGWKLQDMIGIMAPKPDFPSHVQIPDKCVFDATANEAETAKPTDNMAFFRTFHWTWYVVAWCLLWLLLIMLPCFCFCGCFAWWYMKKGKLSPPNEDYDLLHPHKEHLSTEDTDGQLKADAEKPCGCC